MDDVCIYKDPYGVVLVMGPWNYPLQLTLLPAAAAIAAGNCVIMKPSELASESAKFIAETIPKYIDNVSGTVYMHISIYLEMYISKKRIMYKSLIKFRSAIKLC